MVSFHSRLRHAHALPQVWRSQQRMYQERISRKWQAATSVTSYVLNVSISIAFGDAACVYARKRRRFGWAAVPTKVYVCMPGEKHASLSSWQLVVCSKRPARSSFMFGYLCGFPSSGFLNRVCLRRMSGIVRRENKSLHLVSITYVRTSC